MDYATDATLITRISQLEAENAALAADTQLTRHIREIEAGGYDIGNIRRHLFQGQKLYDVEICAADWSYGTFVQGSTFDQAVAAGALWVREQIAPNIRVGSE